MMQREKVRQRTPTSSTPSHFFPKKVRWKEQDTMHASDAMNTSRDVVLTVHLCLNLPPGFSGLLVRPAALKGFSTPYPYPLREEQGRGRGGGGRGGGRGGMAMAAMAM